MRIDGICHVDYILLQARIALKWDIEIRADTFLYSLVQRFIFICCFDFAQPSLLGDSTSPERLQLYCMQSALQMAATEDDQNDEEQP